MKRRDLLLASAGALGSIAFSQRQVLATAGYPIQTSQGNGYPGTVQGLMDAMADARANLGAVYLSGAAINLASNLIVDVPITGVPGKRVSSLSAPQFTISGRGALHNLIATANAWAGFLLVAPQGHVLSNVELSNLAGSVLYITGNTDAYIDNLTIRNAGHDAIDWSEMTGPASLTIDRLLIDGATQHGVNLLIPAYTNPSLIKVRGTDWRVKNINKNPRYLAIAARNCDFDVSQIEVEDAGYGLDLVRCVGARATVKVKRCEVGVVVEDYGDHQVDRCGVLDIYAEDCPQAMEISQAAQGYDINLRTLRGGDGAHVNMAFKGFHLRQQSLYPTGTACLIQSGADCDFDITVIGGGTDAVVVQSQYGILPYRHRITTNVRDTVGYAVREINGQDNFIEGGRQSGGGLGFSLQPSNHARIPNLVI